jgi:dihydroxyacid dehydratase/phosphogluconate dehydratase
MTVPALLDAAGRRRSPATMPGYHAGRPPATRDRNEFRPRLGSAAPRSPELAGFTRADAQLVVARSVAHMDARMSGTSYGAVVLHVAPESAVGGPLALVQTGDRIRLDVEARALDALLDEAELARRRAAWTPPAGRDARGYGRLYENHVLQANDGCGLDFLRGRSPVVTDAVAHL